MTDDRLPDGAVTVYLPSEPRKRSDRGDDTEPESVTECFDRLRGRIRLRGRAGSHHNGTLFETEE